MKRKERLRWPFEVYGLSELVIRELRDTDIEAVSIIEEQCFSMPWKPDDFREMIAKDHMLYVVAELGGTVIGGAGAVLVLENADITNVCISPDYRGNGYGKRMMNGLLDIIKERGCLEVTLEVRKSNLTAGSMYEKLGFENIGIRPCFYEKPVEDAIIMRKFF